jgi:hypothetical protein
VVLQPDARRAACWGLGPGWPRLSLRARAMGAGRPSCKCCIVCFWKRKEKQFWCKRSRVRFPVLPECASLCFVPSSMTTAPTSHKLYHQDMSRQAFFSFFFSNRFLFMLKHQDFLCPQIPGTRYAIS